MDTVSGSPDFFRDFGLIPHDIPPAPNYVIRSYLPLGHIIAQYAYTGVFLGFAIGGAVLLALTLPAPTNVLMTGVMLTATAGTIYFVTRNDYAWVELDGSTIRAKHLYTRRVVERSVDEIKDLLTLFVPVRTVATRLAETWGGRVRGVMIRFGDGRTPLQVARADPTMFNAKELIEAVIARMAERGELDAQIIDLEGKPLIRRVFWKAAN